MKPLKVYLAGPEVFLQQAVEVGLLKKRMCQEFGFEGLFPFDNEVDVSSNYASADAQIYKANIEMIRQADFGIFNLTPFRGISADVGTVFELGAFIGQSKPVFAYTNIEDNLLERVQQNLSLGKDDATGVWLDEHLMSVEDFRNADNLMIDNSLTSQGRRLHRVYTPIAYRYTDLRGFEKCLTEAQQKFSRSTGDWLKA